jgi:phosphomannomutase
VLAQDPDADRFSAAEKGSAFTPLSVRPCSSQPSLDGQWTIFTGDQLGALFASHVLAQYKASGKPFGARDRLYQQARALTYSAKLAMVASTVSSKMVQAMAEKEGFAFVECLTGACRAVLRRTTPR